MSAIEDLDKATTRTDTAETDFRPHFVPQVYTTRKTVAQGMLDFALLMANAAQLKALLDVPADTRHGYHVALVVLIGVSVALQVTVGVIMVVLGSMDIKHQRDHDQAHKLNNSTVGLILFITVINVFIASFGMGGSKNN